MVQLGLCTLLQLKQHASSHHLVRSCTSMGGFLHTSSSDQVCCCVCACQVCCTRATRQPGLWQSTNGDLWLTAALSHALTMMLPPAAPR
jgi:hypothetical protein